MLAIKNNRKNHPILNHTYDLLEELHKQGTLCKVSAHIGIKEADKTAKQVIDLPGMTSTRLFHADYYQTIRRVINSKWQREWENNTSKLHYIKPHIEEWESAHNSNR